MRVRVGRAPWFFSSTVSRLSASQSAFFFCDGEVIDAGLSALHQAGRYKLPQLVLVGAIPLPVAVVPLVMELHRHPIIAKAPELLLELVIQFTLPFQLEKLDHSSAA